MSSSPTQLLHSSPWPPFSWDPIPSANIRSHITTNYQQLAASCKIQRYIQIKFSREVSIANKFKLFQIVGKKDINGSIQSNELQKFRNAKLKLGNYTLKRAVGNDMEESEYFGFIVRFEQDSG